MSPHTVVTWAAVGLTCSFVMAGQVRAGEFYEKHGVAIDGYDPVAYFEDHKADKGNDTLAYSYKGSIFWFASPSHRDRFTTTPERFAPQFGGFCAYGIAEGTKAKSDGDVWEIVDGKLYLNYDRGIQTKWTRGKDVFIREAEAQWPSVQSSTFVHQ